MKIAKIALCICAWFTCATYASPAPEKNSTILILLKAPDSALAEGLAATPGVIAVQSYPVLSSYVINVKNLDTARPYLAQLATKHSAIYRIEHLLPSVEELEASPTAINIRTEDNPYGEGWWAHSGPLKPVTVAIWDGGVDVSHPALNYVKPYCQRADETNPDEALCAKDIASAHGTSIAGIYASILDSYPGIVSKPSTQGGAFRAPGNIKNFLMAEASGPEGNPLQGLAWMLAGNHPSFQVANYSYGNGNLSDTPLGCSSSSYSALAEVFDLAVTASNAVIVKSAGNNKYSATQCTMTLPSDAYNVIAVANINPFDWKKCARGGARKHAKIHEGSSVNAPYEQDARRLLHVTAPGRYINTSGLDPQYCKARCENDAACQEECDSLGAETQGPGNGFWRVSTGTSMSAPMVGAVAALLYGSDVKHSAAVKAIIINSADSWTSNNAPHPISPDANDSSHCDDPNAASHHATKGSHYDRSYGWGVLNADHAYEQREHFYVGALRPGEVKKYMGTFKDFAKATLVWEKAYAEPLNVLEFSLKYKQGHEWVTLMSDLSTVDNVKQVSNGSESLALEPVDADTFMLEIRLSKEAVSKQSFALATEQAFAPVDL